MLADGDEYRHESSGAQELANLLAQIHKFQAGAGAPRGNIAANQRAQAHAVDAGKIGELENDPLCLGQQQAYLLMKVIAGAGDQFAGQVHHNTLTFVNNFKRKRAGCGGHGNRFSHTPPWSVHESSSVSRR